MTIIISSFIKNTRPNICNIFERGVFQRLQRWQNWQTCNYCQLFFWGMHCLLGLVCLYIISQDRQDCDKKKSRDCLHSDHDGCSPVQIFCQQTVAAPAWMGQKSEDWQTTIMVGFMWVLCIPHICHRYHQCGEISISKRDRNMFCHDSRTFVWRKITNYEVWFYAPLHCGTCFNCLFVANLVRATSLLP